MQLEKFEEILAKCIDDIKAGKSTVEDCLDKYPSIRTQLEPLLKVALEIQQLPDVQPSPAFKLKARVWLMDQIHERWVAAKWPWLRNITQVKPMPYIKKFSTSMAGIILAIALAISGLGVGTVYASQSSLPGDNLYPLKLATEQAVMILVREDVTRAERALSFADKRVTEMELLAERGRFQELYLALEKYRYCLNITMTNVEQICSEGVGVGNVTARVAEATTKHLLVLDRVWDMVPDEAKAAIAQAMNVSQTGYFHALAALARNNTALAAEISLTAMEARLNRMRLRVQNQEALQIALGQFEAMAEFGEHICRIAQQLGLNTTEVEELVAEASGKHLQVLAGVWEQAPEQAKPAIERAMANVMMRHQRRAEALQQKGIEPPPSPAIPERVQQRIQERIREREQQSTPNETPSAGKGVPGGIQQGNGQGRT